MENKKSSKNQNYKFELTSKDFRDRGTIPTESACEWLGGKNKSPHLSWSSPPENTKMYALIMIDRGDVKGTRETRHWSVYNIPESISGFASGEKLASIEGIAEGENYEKREGYAGPCPRGKHLYRFVVFALNGKMPLIEKGVPLSESEFVAAYGSYILDSARLEGYFEPSTFTLYLNKIKRAISRLLE